MQFYILVLLSLQSVFAHVQDLQLVFNTRAMRLTTEVLQVALHLTNEQHLVSRALAVENEQDNGHVMSLLCASYRNVNEIKSYLSEMNAEDDQFHPVYLSKSNDRGCYFYTHRGGPIPPSTDSIAMTSVPHVLKIDPSVDFVLSEYSSYQKSLSSSSFIPIILEIALFTGVNNPSSKCCDHHEEVMTDIITSVRRILLNPHDKEDHQNNFFFTQELNFEDKEFMHHSSKYRDVTDDAVCTSMLATMDVSHVNTHMKITVLMDHKKATIEETSPCVRLVTSVASLHPSVSHISAHFAPTIMIGDTKADIEELVSDSIDYTLASPATDQNAYVQSGTSDQYPYTDGLELDGNGYVLGMIDSGIDDLSCFLRDYNSSEITTRTAKGEYDNPITEPFRRKVIQYVAWADDGYRVGRDHGTWCGGASIGKCDNATSAANAYNGLAKNSQITMFDVDANGDWLDVPSLYNIALPPAYEAGARVHSNSWGTPGIGSYTSKALDVDRFMLENPDFLFVVAAGNAGRSGYSSVHSPGVSKNALTVGASAAAPHHDTLVYFSSLGYGYDQHMIKPNVVAPGTQLTSAGVRMGNESTSCNVQIMSGTSMATPMAAASAILVKQYFEEQASSSARWSTICRSAYRSCPTVNSNGGQISGPLLKAIMMHSGEGMKATSASSSSVLPPVNLTSPPDRYQGWGQIQLSNVLPLSPGDAMDLYVADQEMLTSFTKRFYYVEVTGSSLPLTVSIVWNDPPNVMWATKNLLHDLDLVVTYFDEQNDVTKIYHGNNIDGDEFNPCERVQVKSPSIGVYEVQVLAHSLPVFDTDDQHYSIVISSEGYVQEAETTTEPISFDSNDHNSIPSLCGNSSAGNGMTFVRFQLEDWQAGLSWNNEPLLTVVKNNFIPLGDKGNERYLSNDEDFAVNCTFPPNSQTQMSSSNRIHQCGVCLDNGSSYTVTLDTDSAFNHSSQYIRVSSQYNDVFLSQYLKHTVLDVDADGVCNSCMGEGYSEVVVLMLSNVTDDDYVEYSWHGAAHYTIRHDDGVVAAAGTLLISDEQADRYCLPHGDYTLELEDSELAIEFQRNAKAIFYYPSPTVFNQQANVTLFGTMTELISLQPAEYDNISDSNNDDDDASIYIIPVVVMFGVAIIGGILWHFRHKLPKQFTFYYYDAHDEEVGESENEVL